MTEKLGKKYKILVEKIVSDCCDAYTYSKSADSIFLCKDNYKENYDLKQKFAKYALARIESVEGLFNVIYEEVKRGDPTFGNKEQRDKVFVDWGDAIVKARNILRKMPRVNRERKTQWDKELKESQLKKKERLNKNTEKSNLES